MRKLSEKTIGKIYEWDALPKDTRISQNALAKREGISTVVIWKTLKDKPAEETKDEYDTFISHLRVEVYKVTCPVRRQELYAQLMGWKVDKSEVKLEVGISADEHHRIRREGQRRLQEELGERAGGTGGLLAGVQGVHLLPEEVCVDNQQEHSEEG